MSRGAMSKLQVRFASAALARLSQRYHCRVCAKTPETVQTTTRTSTDGANVVQRVMHIGQCKRSCAIRLPDIAPVHIAIPRDEADLVLFGADGVAPDGARQHRQAVAPLRLTVR